MNCLPIRHTATLVAVSLLLGACSGESLAPAPPDQPASATPAPAATSLTLPVSLNAVMVGAIDHASDPLFGVGNALFGSGKLPKSDDDWLEVQYHAYQMIILGKVIQLPGTGPMDVEWTSKPEWTSYSESLTAVGMEMLNLAEAKDASGFAATGDKLVGVCEGCHQAFKPDIPTMKIMHKSEFPPANK